MAQTIGQRLWFGTTETMYRLSRPLQDVAPDWRNVVVAIRSNGERQVYRGRAYQRADGTWSAIPGDNSWRACYGRLSERDLTLIENEVAAA